MRVLISKTIITLLLSLGLSACAEQTTRAGVVGVDRQQTMLVSSREINQAAAQAYAGILADADKKHQLNRDPRQVALVRQIGLRLIPASAVFRSDAPGWQWEGHVISSPEVNAWCMPGGKVAVYTGFFEKLQPSEDELAAVIGHEIAHALREHGRERASQGMMADLGLTVLGAATGMSRGQMDLAGAVTNLTILMPNSRRHETEADRIGVELAARAGYDPRAAVSLWQKMQRVSGGQPPQWLSTHPSHTARIADLERYAEKVMPLYQAARR